CLQLCFVVLFVVPVFYSFGGKKVMGAPLPFFQVTESGRITSRFSSDFDSIDLVIPASLSSFMDAGDYLT
ncbi:unnamed protein product, partial [Laminaria digitata]